MINYEKHFSLVNKPNILDVFIYNVNGMKRVDLFITDISTLTTNVITIKDENLTELLRQLNILDI